jgi:hypothetical protein
MNPNEENFDLLQHVCNLLNEQCTFQSFSKWYTVKDGQIHWQNEDTGGALDETAIFELLGGVQTGGLEGTFNYTRRMF